MVAGVESHAATTVALEFDFDSLATGSPANAALPIGLSLDNAFYDYEYDGFGDPIGGTLRWRRDPTAPAVLADDPSLFGRGPAPSPNNALEALYQPVLLSLGGLTDALMFRTTLDLDSFGENGLLPGFEDVAIQFLGFDGSPVLSLLIDQTTPGFLATAGPLNGIAGILFPAGAFYDDIEAGFDPRPPVAAIIPEPGTWMAAGLFSAVLASSRLWRFPR